MAVQEPFDELAQMRQTVREMRADAEQRRRSAQEHRRATDERLRRGVARAGLDDNKPELDSRDDVR